MKSTIPQGAEKQPTNCELMLKEFEKQKPDQIMDYLAKELRMSKGGGYFSLDELNNGVWDPAVRDDIGLVVGGWVNRENNAKLPDADRNQILELLLLLSKLSVIDKVITIQNHYFKNTDYGYLYGKDSEELKYSRILWGNDWKFKVGCIEAIFRMPDEKRKLFIDEFKQIINNDSRLTDQYSQHLQAEANKMPTFEFQYGASLIQIPISDHELITADVNFGSSNADTATIGSFNIWCPGTRMAANVYKSLNLLDSPVLTGPNSSDKMDKTAQYIIKKFKEGVGLLALQEVPNPTDPNFEILEKKLQEYAQAANVSINLGDLKGRWQQTQGHRFGTSVLVNPARFEISADKTAIDGRGAEYQVKHVGSNQTFQVVNIHLDYDKATDQIKMVEQQNEQGKICLGDTNSQRQLTSKNQNSFQYEGKLNTYDVILLPQTIKMTPIIQSKSAAAASSMPPSPQQQTNSAPAKFIELDQFSKITVNPNVEKDTKGNDYYLVIYANRHNPNNTPTNIQSRIYLNGAVTNGNGSSPLKPESSIRAKLPEIIRSFNLKLPIDPYKFANSNTSITSLEFKEGNKPEENYYLVHYGDQKTQARIYTDGRLKNSSGNFELGKDSPLRNHLAEILKHFGINDVKPSNATSAAQSSAQSVDQNTHYASGPKK